MQRRNFLGSLLGIFTGSQIDWVARNFTNDLIEQPKNILPNYRLGIRTEDNFIIQGPGVIDIDEKYGFIFTPIDIKEELIVRNAILYYKNIVVSEKSFDHKIPMYPGDVLKINHQCQINYHGQIIKPTDSEWEHLLQEFLKRKYNENTACRTGRWNLESYSL